MPGTKGHSGGRREGAGAPIRKWTLRRNESYLVHIANLDWPEPMWRATVTQMNDKAITIMLEDGTSIAIIRN